MGFPVFGFWVCMCSLRESLANADIRLGGIIYIASLVGFILLLATHIVRFLLKPRLIRASITHPSEGLFVSTFAAALGILIIDGATYAEKMHTAHGIALRASFWIFLVVSVIFGVGSPLAQCAPSLPFSGALFAVD